jgi:nucleoside-diphosphate-sugar epimerase
MEYSKKKPDATVMRQATILGGRGFIGRALDTHLSAQGWSVWVPERSQRWPVIGQPLGHVFYCAGLTSDYMRRPADAIEAHVCLLRQVLQSTDYESLVYLSSTRVYDALTGQGAVTEDMPIGVQPGNPRHLYDLSKLTGESLCHALGQGRAKVARLACVYQENREAGGFLPELLQRLSRDAVSILEVDSSPGYVRDYVHLDDVVRALVDIAVRGGQAAYNVASGVNVSNAELADCICQASGKRLHFLRQGGADQVPVVDITRFVEEFGWRPAPVQAWVRRYFLSK